jgi:hypothetical protein
VGLIGRFRRRRRLLLESIDVQQIVYEAILRKGRVPDEYPYRQEHKHAEPGGLQGKYVQNKTKAYNGPYIPIRGADILFHFHSDPLSYNVAPTIGGGMAGLSRAEANSVIK